MTGRALRWALDKIDSGCPYLHHSTPFTNEVKGRREYDSDRTRELQGHPLPCAQVNCECLSTLRLLRAVAPPGLCSVSTSVSQKPLRIYNNMEMDMDMEMNFAQNSLHQPGERP